jgi:hypothetical protein
MVEVERIVKKKKKYVKENFTPEEGKTYKESGIEFSVPEGAGARAEAYREQKRQDRIAAGISQQNVEAASTKTLLEKRADEMGLADVTEESVPTIEQIQEDQNADIPEADSSFTSQLKRAVGLEPMISGYDEQGNPIPFQKGVAPIIGPAGSTSLIGNAVKGSRSLGLTKLASAGAVSSLIIGNPLSASKPKDIANTETALNDAITGITSLIEEVRTGTKDPNIAQFEFEQAVSALNRLEQGMKSRGISNLPFWYKGGAESVAADIERYKRQLPELRTQLIVAGQEGRLNKARASLGV